MKVGIDIDDVVAEYVHDFLRWLNHVSGVELNYDTLLDENLYSLPAKKEDIDEAFRLSHMHLRNLTPAHRAALNIRDIVLDGHDVTFVTSRDPKYRRVTLEWLYGRDMLLGSVLMTPYKGHMCRKMGIDVMIEDMPKHLMRCQASGIPTIVFDQPWNGRTLYANERVYYWDQVPKALEKVQRYRESHHL